MSIIKYLLPAFFSFIVLYTMACQGVTKQVSQFDKSQIIDLKLKQVNKDTIHFQFTNKGKEAFDYTPIAINYNRLIFVTESGQKVEYYGWADMIPEKVPPNASKNRDFNISRLLEYLGLQDEKNLKLIWSVDGVESSPILLNN